MRYADCGLATAAAFGGSSGAGIEIQHGLMQNSPAVYIRQEDGMFFPPVRRLRQASLCHRDELHGDSVKPEPQCIWSRSAIRWGSYQEAVACRVPGRPQTRRRAGGILEEVVELKNNAARRIHGMHKHNIVGRNLALGLPSQIDFGVALFILDRVASN